MGDVAGGCTSGDKGSCIGEVNGGYTGRVTGACTDGVTGLSGRYVKLRTSSLLCIVHRPRCFFRNFAKF